MSKGKMVALWLRSPAALHTLPRLIPCPPVFTARPAAEQIKAADELDDSSDEEDEESFQQKFIRA